MRDRKIVSAISNLVGLGQMIYRSCKIHSRKIDREREREKIRKFVTTIYLNLDYSCNCLHLPCCPSRRDQLYFSAFYVDL